MKLTRKKATVLNMIFSATYQVITMLFGFILPNLLLNNYGAELHGYTSTVGNVMSYIAIINAGLAPAAVEALYKPLAEKDTNRINEILNAINRFYVKSGMLYTVAVVISSVVLPLVVKEQIPGYAAVSLMLVIGATNTLDCFIYSKYRVLFQADQRLFDVYLIDAIAYLARIAVQVALIITGADIVIVMGIPALMVMARTLGLSVVSKRIYPYLSSQVKPDNSSLHKRWNAMAHQLAGLIVYNTDVTLLTLFGNLVQVSIYSVYSLVFNNIYNMLTNIFSTGTLASFGQLLNEDRRERLIEAFNIYEYGYYAVVSFVYSVTASLILPFVSVYTKKYQDVGYVDYKLALLFMIIGIANNMRVPSGTMINAAGHFKETQWRAVLEATINLTVSLVLIKPFGMYGILFGTICSFAYRTTDIIYYSHRYVLKISCKQTILRIVRTIISILISIALYRVIFGVYIMNSWIQWVLYAVGASIISILIVGALNYILEPAMFKSCLNSFVKKK